jgi:uncharacterized membrane protein YtjA (UPF0391 family)
MLRWSLGFLVIALITAMFGFELIAGLSHLAVGIAKGLFFLFLILFVVSLVAGSRTTKDAV